MIRYSCDLCKRDLDPSDDLRYVVKMEVYAAFDPAAVKDDEDDRDHLQEIQDILEAWTTSTTRRSATTCISNSVSTFAPSAAKNFEDPLGREMSLAKVFGFSRN